MFFYELMLIASSFLNHEKHLIKYSSSVCGMSLHPQSVCPVSCGGQCENFDGISFNKNTYKRLFKCFYFI